MYSDKNLTCADCGQEFVFTASEQDFYAQRGFTEPRRCASCRASRKAARNADTGGGSSYDVMPISNGSFGMPSIASEGIQVTAVTDFSSFIPASSSCSDNPYRLQGLTSNPPGIPLSIGTRCK